MELKFKRGELPIPRIYIVGYGRTQCRQFVCYSCKTLYFSNEGFSENQFLCNDCVQKDGEVKVESDIDQYFHILGFKQKIACDKKRTIYNFKKVAERDHYTCQYCGYTPRLFLSFKQMHVDHIRPFSTGGNNSLSNLVMACSECNLKLSNKIFRDFYDKKIYIIDWRKQAGLPFTQSQWEAISERTAEEERIELL